MHLTKTKKTLTMVKRTPSLSFVNGKCLCRDKYIYFEIKEGVLVYITWFCKVKNVEYRKEHTKDVPKIQILTIPELCGIPS